MADKNLLNTRMLNIDSLCDLSGVITKKINTGSLDIKQIPINGLSTAGNSSANLAASLSFDSQKDGSCSSFLTSRQPTMPIDFEQQIIEDCLRNLAIPMPIKQENHLKEDGFKVPKAQNVFEDS